MKNFSYTSTKFFSLIICFTLSLAMIQNSASVALATELTASDFEGLLERAEKRRNRISRIMEKSTIIIVAEDDDSLSFGTGFVVAQNYILTNGHVTEGADTIYVAGLDFELIEAKLIAEINTNTKDFALLHFQFPAQLPILSFNYDIQRAEVVSAWGYPVLVTQFDKRFNDLVEEGEFTGLPPIVYTQGHISSFVDDNGARNIIHTASIAGGNSGGPLVNTSGEVVGINTWGASEEDGGTTINGALTAQDAVAFLRKHGVNPLVMGENFQPSMQSPSQIASQTNQPNFPSQSNQPSFPSQTNQPSQSASNGISSISSITQTISNSLPNQGSSISGIVAGVSSIAGGFTASSNNSSSKAEDVNQSNFSQSHQVNQNDFSKDFLELLPLAESGDADAQAFVGVSFLFGDEAPYDLEKAVFWLKKASAQNQADAMAMLGTVYITDPDYKNTAEGLKLIEKGAKKDPDYAYIMADFLLFGTVFGIENDHTLAYKYIQQGVAVDDYDANALLAFCYTFGIEVDINYQKAFSLATRASEQGSVKADAILALLYAEGNGVEHNPKQAFEYATTAAENGDAFGMGLLANFYYEGKVVPENFEKSLEWAKLAIADGDGYGIFTMGLLYANGLAVTQNIPLAWAYFNFAEKMSMSNATKLSKELEADMSPQQMQDAKQYVEILSNQWGL